MRRGRELRATLLAAVAAAVGGAVAQAPAPAPAPTSQCTLQLPTGTETFDHCFLVDGIGDNFFLSWTLSKEDGQRFVRWGMNSSSRGYVAIGYPPYDPTTGEELETGLMIGANAIALQTCNNCPEGIELEQWYLGGTATGDIDHADVLLVENVTAVEIGSGMAAAFTQQLPAGLDPAALTLIFASGGVYGNGHIKRHETYGEATFNLRTGEIADGEQHSMNVNALVAAHLWLMLLGWGVFIPVGIVISRCLKYLDPWWFQLHRALQTLGLLMGLAGFGIGFAIANGWNGVSPTHRDIGMVATILGLLQMPALVMRPNKYSRWRRSWNFWHWWQGRIAALLAVANVFYGLINVDDVSSGSWAAYTAVFAVIVGSAIAMDGYAYVHLPPPAVTPGLQKPLPSQKDLKALQGSDDSDNDEEEAAGAKQGLATNGGLPSSGV